jgi:nucleoside-diphosphate-sugar epimerase
MQSKSPQRILITGGAGFIGSHTADLLLSQGREVVVLDNLSTGKLENLNLQHPDLEFIEGDVLEYPFLEELVTRCDAVLHLAAIVSVPLSIENPIYSFQVNTQGLLHVLQASHAAKHPIRVVFASSAAVYGNSMKPPCRDDARLESEPLSPYALQKIHDEDYAGLYARIYGISSLALRYFNVYGSRQDPSSPYSGVISRFLDAYKHNTELTIFGDGKQSRDFIHVMDVARANMLALNSNYHGALNIATGQPHTLLEVIEYLQSADKPARIRFEPERAGDIKNSYASTHLAEQQLGFKHVISLREGMRMMTG